MRSRESRASSPCSVAPILRVHAEPDEHGCILIYDQASLFAPVEIWPTSSRTWRKTVLAHVSANSGVPIREIVRELQAAELVARSVR